MFIAKDGFYYVLHFAYVHMRGNKIFCDFDYCDASAVQWKSSSVIFFVVVVLFRHRMSSVCRVRSLIFT